MNIFEKHSRPTTIMMAIIVALELVLSVILLKSDTLAFFVLLLLLMTCTVFRYPEFGLAYALAGNTLIIVLFDHMPPGINKAVLFFFLFLVIGGSLVYFLRYGIDSKVQFGKPILFALLLGIVMILGMSFTSNPEYARNKIGLYFVVNFILILTPLVFVNDIDKIKHIPSVSFVWGLISAIVITLMALHSPVYIRFTPTEGINPIWVARALGVSFLLGIYLFIVKKNHIVRLLLILCTLFFIYPMLRTWSRAPLLGLFICIFLFFLLQPGQSLTRKLTVSLPILFGGIYVVISASTEFTARLKTPLSEEASAAFRFLAWFKSLQDFSQSPILGMGTGSFNMDILLMDFRYPHNLILEIAGENGLVGLLFLIGFLFVSLRIGMNTIQDFYQKDQFELTQLSVAFMVIFIYALWNAMFSGDIAANEIVWLSSGLLYTLWLSQRPGTKKN